MPTYRIDLGYDGSGFHGYARNRGVRTIQGDLEAALRRLLGGDVTTVVAGRTDAGVHARGQVVSFEAEPLDPARLERSLRSMLGPEIAITAVRPAESGFDARFSAQWRRYRYFVAESPVIDPLARHTTWHVGVPLDRAAMNAAAGHFVGTHDFASLCRAQKGRGTERTLLDAAWDREDTRLVFDVRAEAFCHQMVRSMVALCVEVGRGRLQADAVPGILEARDRNAARGAAPPHGLVLWEVGY
ncbi:MAG: tRNA pseudouridine(38-40) synthase TruA [Acidimicrobiia bacterium]